MASRINGLYVARVPLSNGVRTPITPPGHFRSVTIGNAGSGTIQVDTGDLTQYLVVDAGYERPIDLTTYLFTDSQIAFWLTASVDGTVVLIWR